MLLSKLCPPLSDKPHHFSELAQTSPGFLFATKLTGLFKA